jgi:tetratricopeptide (TPR) repeat protein
LQEGDQAWLIGEAAFSLRALGRLGEALEPMRAGAEMGVRQEDWKNAASGHSNLSELELSLGRTQEAVADAKRSVAYADRSGDAFQRISKRSTLADARHQAGEIEAARKSFVEAESLQAKDQPDYPLLYSLQGFQYCDLLLAGAERAVWVGIYSDKGARLTADVGINSDPVRS